MLSVKLLALLFAIPVAAQSTATKWAVDFRTAGPVRIGMTLQEVRAALNDKKATLDKGPEDDPNSCAYLTSKTVPNGLGIMFVNRRVARFDVTQPGIRFTSGVGVGDATSKVRLRFPGIRSAPDPYDEDWRDYTFKGKDADRGYGIIFVTEKNKVHSFRAGRFPPVAWIEGCL